MLDERFGWMFDMRFWARNNVRRRGCSGKLPSCAMSLSVRSIASLSCCAFSFPFVYARYSWSLLAQRPYSQWQRSCGLDITHIDINSAPKCSICSFQRTSQIEFTLRETIDEGQGVVDHVGSEPHVCDGVATVMEGGNVDLGYIGGGCVVL
jgi:hypothetical protein